MQWQYYLIESLMAQGFSSCCSDESNVFKLTPWGSSILGIVLCEVDEQGAVDRYLGKSGNILGTAVGF